ncbi:MAG: alpha/beta hydrolase [Pseudomonadota bacterium]
MSAAYRPGLSTPSVAPPQDQTVVLAHSSASSPKQWTTLAAALPPTIAPGAITLVGHGAEPVWGGERALTVAEEAKAIEATARDARIHLVGHSYGGAVALRFALAHPEQLRSLTLIEPSCFHVLARDAEHQPLLKEVETLVARLNAGVIAGDYRRAMALFVEYWNGVGAWDAAPEHRKASLAAKAILVAHHFSRLLGDDWPLSALEAIKAPVLILCGDRSPKPSRAITRTLAEAIPQARHRTIRGAGHMAPITHPEAVNPLIVEHLERSAAHQASATDPSAILGNPTDGAVVARRVGALCVRPESVARREKRKTP